MKEILTRPALFSVVDTETMAYRRRIEVEKFGETLIDGMLFYGINIENPNGLDLKVPTETLSKDFLFSIPVIGILQKNKFNITLSKSGHKVMIEILCFNEECHKWEQSEFQEFMPMDEFDEKFPTFLEILVHTLPFQPWY